METVYILKDTLLGLLADQRIVRFRLASRAGQGCLSLVYREGVFPGLLTGDGQQPVELIFSSGGAEVRFARASGERVRVTFDEARDGSVARVINEPLFLPRLAGRAVAFAEETPPPPAAGMDSEALNLLLRHASVSDLLFGSDGQECSLQFQISNGCGGTSRQSPRDWIGIDFNDRNVDLGWFDTDGSFRSRHWRLPEDSAETDHLFADPLGHVLKNDDEAGLSQSETGMRSLLLQLQTSFGASTPAS